MEPHNIYSHKMAITESIQRFWTKTWHFLTKKQDKKHPKNRKNMTKNGPKQTKYRQCLCLICLMILRRCASQSFVTNINTGQQTWLWKKNFPENFESAEIFEHSEKTTDEIGRWWAPSGANLSAGGLGARGEAPENFQILHPPDAWKQRFTTFFTAKGPVKLFQIWWSSHPFLTIPTKLPLIYLGTLLGAKEPSSNMIKQIPSHPYQASLWFIWEPYWFLLILLHVLFGIFDL